MAVDIGPKIGIQGEREFRAQIQQINQSMKTLAAEGEAVASAFDDDTSAEKKATAQKELLNRQIEAQKDKLALLERGLSESAKMYGEADTRTLKWQQAVHEATATLNDMERELSELDKDVDETTDSMQDAGAAASGWADVMKGQLLADAVKAGLQKVVNMAEDIASAMWSASEAGAAYADEINTLAATTGLSTDALQEYKYMAELTDVSLETITGSMTKLVRSMNSAREEKGEAAEVFKELGIAVKDSAGNLRDSQTVFNEAITALGKIENETERDAAAMTLFGKSARDLNPLIKTGADKLEALAKEAHDAGYVLSGEALQALQKQQDAQDRLAKKTEALSKRFAAGLAPSVEKATSKLDEMASSPKVRQALDDASKAIGSVIEGAVGLAEKALPLVMGVFGIFDEKIRLYTEEELELIQSTDDAIAAHKELTEEYKNKADAIVEETNRTKALWQELQTLVDENGKVKGADENRAKFITETLNDTLGTQFEWEGKILTNYHEQANAIDQLIAKREAEALLGAQADRNAANREDRDAAILRAAELKEELDEARESLLKATANYEEVVAKGTVGRALEMTEQAKEEAEARVNGLLEKYQEAQAEYQRVFAEIENYENAQAAAAVGNYEESVRLLESELEFTAEYYAKKKELSEQDKKDLAQKIEETKKKIEEYKIALENGTTGFSEAGLREWEGYVKNLTDILEGRIKDVKAMGKDLGEAYGDGIELGILNSEGKINKAAVQAANAAKKGFQTTLQIASPSKVAVWMGRMFDEGIIKGLEDQEREIAKTAASLAKAVEENAAPRYVDAYEYGAQTGAPIGSYNAETAYTTNMGGITIHVDGAGAVNEDVLAGRIVTRLTNELNRSRRASG
ncbi:MAG: hypothetical protein IKO68_11105 [Oscillospiraceae bacterium]|nr:hypothetical protein [Oscillospiraceae bacterium]MBR4657081.1 hypothetical protein [Oscillospiraceae bacterium]